jgi:hypothetical protein
VIVVVTYVSDLGIVSPYLKMDIAFLGENLTKVNDLAQIADIAPANLLQELKKTNFSSCEAGISPRFAILNFRDGRQLKLPYPFRPGSLDWQIFWNDLLANPQVISARGVGETLTNPLLKRLL